MTSVLVFLFSLFHAVFFLFFISDGGIGMFEASLSLVLVKDNHKMVFF